MEECNFLLKTPSKHINGILLGMDNLFIQNINHLLTISYNFFSKQINKKLFIYEINLF